MGLLAKHVALQSNDYVYKQFILKNETSILIVFINKKCRIIFSWLIPFDNA